MKIHLWYSFLTTYGVNLTYVIHMYCYANKHAFRVFTHNRVVANVSAAAQNRVVAYVSTAIRVHPMEHSGLWEPFETLNI